MNWIATGVLASACVFASAARGGEVNFAREKGVAYKVVPEVWNKAVMSTPLAGYIDKDLDKDANTRKGMLVDGVIFQPVAVRYNYNDPDWNKNKISVEMDLGQERKISSVKLFAVKGNELFDIKKVMFEGSLDGLEFEKIGGLDEGDVKLVDKFVLAAIVEVGGKTFRHLKITAWTTSWIDLSEVEAWGE